MFIWMIFMIFLYIFCVTTPMIIFHQVSFLYLCLVKLSHLVCGLLKVIHDLKTIMVSFRKSCAPYNYYNTLTWTYKFFSRSDCTALFNNSDLSFCIKLRRVSVPYTPIFPKTFFFENVFGKTTNFYLILDRNIKLVLKQYSFNLNESFIFHANAFSSLVLQNLFSGFAVLVSNSKVESDKKLLFVGSYDPTNNNLYDHSFLNFLSLNTNHFSALNGLSFMQNFSSYRSFSLSFNFFFSFFSFFKIIK